jgi:amidohydrolase
MTNLAEAKGLREKLIAWRRDFHMHPELSFKEVRSAAIIAEHLRRLGYDVRTEVARTGVVGLLQGNRSGPVVAFRFDMDALPVTEETGAPYASTIEGQMHACGHDGHMAVGMGLAELLAARRDDINGAVKLLFQPAEEGGNGAEAMVKAGALESPRPDVFVASHVWIERPVGSADVCTGPVLAAADKWECTIRGRGGHGAMPHHTADPIVAAAQVISALQTVVSRNVPALEPAVVSVGSIHAGDAFNVIPEAVRMTGTIRTYEQATRDMVVQRVREVVEGVAAACGATAELRVRSLTPAVINDATVAEVVREAAQAILGVENVTSRERTTGSEDAAFFMREVPGCYFFLGASNPERGIVFPHHSSRFDIDEEALVYGVALLAQVAEHYLLVPG